MSGVTTAVSPPALKLVYAAAILLVSLAGLRWAARLTDDSRTGHGLANAFAAGIFLGTGLLHFAVEARAGWQVLGRTFPWTELIALCAFLLLLFIEHVALTDAAHSVVHAHSGGHEPAHAHTAQYTPSSSGKSYGVLAALSLHSFLAGLALGAARDLTQISLAAAAILAHKLTEGFALGAVLSGDMSAARARLSGWVFAVATPVGILLGALALPTAGGSDGSLADTVISSLAAGTFLYIGTFDLLQDEFVRPGGRVAKWLLACVGVAISALLAAVL